MDSLRAAARKPLPQFLSHAVDSGHVRIGQILIQKRADGYLLRHESDADRRDLKIYRSPEDATEIARLDDTDRYRPLKTAPNLARGWELRLESATSLRTALDLLYPAAAGNWRAVLRGEKIAPPLRETLNRQTGMYRITAKSNTAELRGIMDSLCKAGCLRQILWPIESGDPSPAPENPADRIPLFCTNPCSLFLGKVRTTVKNRPAES